MADYDKIIIGIDPGTNNMGLGVLGFVRIRLKCWPWMC